MKRHLWLLLSGVCVAGCMASNALQYDAMSETNLYRIAKIRKGMSEKQVLQVMHKPYDYQTYEVAGDVYDIWFYVTRTTGLDQTRMVPQNLTPLTFKNGILVGTGYYWYYYAMNGQAAEVAKENPTPQPKTQQEEDQEFEKLLKTYPEQKPPVQQTSSCGEVAKARAPGTPLAATPSSLSRIQLGMTESEVTSILEPPSNYETYYINRDVYDIWFYEIISPANEPQTVPLTFKNGVLVGMTNKFYEKVKQKSGQESINGYTEEAEQGEEEESDQNFNYW